MPQIRTAVVHPVEPERVHLAEVKVLTNDVVEFWDFGGDGGEVWVHIERERPIMHDRLVVICRVLVGDVVIVVFVEVVLHPCRTFNSFSDSYHVK